MVTFLIFLLLLVVVSGVDNSTVLYYYNELSACNHNIETGNVLCINNKHGGDNIQYHGVSDVIMCDYHYCIMYGDESDEFTCSGYVYNMLGIYSRIFNPLSPNISMNEFGTHVPVGKPFNGYNIVIKTFDQDVRTTVTKQIESIDCYKDYGTIVIYDDSNMEKFGIIDVNILNDVETLAVGFVINCMVSVLLYSLLLLCRTNKYTFPVTFIVTLSCVIIELSTLVVKVYPFLLSATIGFIVGSWIVSFLYEKFCHVSVVSPNEIFDVQESSQFVIEEEGDSDASGDNIELVSSNPQTSS